MANAPAIPPFREDGYLPEGMYVASLAEVTFRFGASTPRRRSLTLRLRRWVELARAVGARRFFVDGSFVTSKTQPNDVDAVVLLAPDFEARIMRGSDAAIELAEMLLSREPEEIFAAEDQDDWDEWVEFFTRTREADGRRKGLVEIEL